MPPPAEISIPTTSLAQSSPKPYTLYNITLRLPLRSFVVQKRYSDFAALNTTLTSHVGAQPPAPLPGKSWFRSTVSSPEMTENRRAGLEKYLRAIAESPDRRWRDHPAWRAFLGLPSSTAGSAASASGVGIEGRVPAIGLGQANAAAAADPGTWIDMHKEMKRALHDARLHLARRDAAVDGGAGRGGSAATEAGAAAKRELVKVGSLLAALADGLRTMQDAGRVGDGEVRRRRDLLNAARVEKDGLEKLSASLASARVGGSGGPAAAAGDKKELVGTGSNGVRSGGRVLGAPLPETERTRELDNEGVLLLQQKQMAEQDQDVEMLQKIIRRQKEMGQAIHREVEEQTDMLKRVDEDVDRVGSKIKVAKDRTRRLGK